MKNVFLLAAVFACHAAAAKVEAAQYVSATISETRYVVAQYSAAQAQQLQNEIGYMPKRNLTPPGGTQVWAAFDTKSENAERLESYSTTSFIVSRSRFAMAIQDCKNNPTTDYTVRPFCSPEFLKLAEVIND
mgnify:CR=1 FL=1